MGLDNPIGTIEACQTIEELCQALQKIIGEYGFANFAFVDVGHPESDKPLVLATTDKTWDEEYRNNGFIHVDPVIPVVRRTNVPFHWGAVPLPQRRGKRKPGALKTMEAAADHGLKEGLVIPFHFIDRLGRMNSASCVFFWKDRKSQFFRAIGPKKHELHIILLYWAQCVMDLVAERDKLQRRMANAAGEDVSSTVLTDRERDALSWAARGKTMAETAIILSISAGTVETHLKSAIRKLGAVNKTQAVVRAVHGGLIDV